MHNWLGLMQAEKMSTSLTNEYLVFQMSTWKIVFQSIASIRSNFKSRQVEGCKNVVLSVCSGQPLHIDNLTALIKTGTLSKASPDTRLSPIDLPHPFPIWSASCVWKTSRLHFLLLLSVYKSRHLNCYYYPSLTHTVCCVRAACFMAQIPLFIASCLL